MARSVYVPRSAISVVYAEFDGQDCDDFDDAIDNVRYAIQARYRSMQRCNDWLGEARIIMENDKCMICVAAYGNLVSVSAVPKGEGCRARVFCEKVQLEQPASYFGDLLELVGRFSNGEALFNRKAGKNKGAMGLGYSSKEGWL